MANDDPSPDKKLGNGPSTAKPDTPGKPPQTPKPDPNQPLSHPPRVVDSPRQAEPNKVGNTNKRGVRDCGPSS